jgi:hypothetical protein
MTFGVEGSHQLIARTSFEGLGFGPILAIGL